MNLLKLSLDYLFNEQMQQAQMLAAKKKLFSK